MVGVLQRSPAFAPSFSGGHAPSSDAQKLTSGGPSASSQRAPVRPGAVAQLQEMLEPTAEQVPPLHGSPAHGSLHDPLTQGAVPQALPHAPQLF